MVVYLRVTDRCNLNCRHCYSQKGDSDMSLEALKKAGELYPRAKFIFHGGEPSMVNVSWLYRAVDILKDNPLSMQSNLVSLSDEFIEFMLEFKERFGSSIGTSLDLERIKHKKAILDNVCLLAELGFEVTAIITITTPQVEPYFQLIEEFLKAGGRWFKFQIATPVNGEGFLPVEKIREIFLRGLNVRGNQLWKMINNYSCGFPISLFGGNCGRHVRTINPDGTIHVCPELAGEGLTQFSIGDVTNGETNKGILSLFAKREAYLRNHCKENCWGYCAGGCFSMAYHSGFFPADPYCEVYQSIEEVISII